MNPADLIARMLTALGVVGLILGSLYAVVAWLQAGRDVWKG